MVAKNSAFIITARNSKFLEEVKKIMQKNNDIYVHIIEGDMINLNDAFFDKFEKAMNEILSITKSFDALLLVNNAGTLGAINKPAIDLGCREIWQEYLQINLISMIQLTNFVLKKLPFEMIPTQFVINITSLCSIKALPSLCQYCVGKAGREAFFRSLAAENPSLRILSYSPGPVRTDMYNELSTG
ncbi:unnamed protein product [Dracunculus medinensis]|uniref:Sepiapterin reductase n=1 Tax=Dracunculus medinensis TaxID=318479 RepID=A0A0N4UA06_DRAME|nr:unnamed protein product [Dracunculus medinensis]